MFSCYAKSKLSRFAESPAGGGKIYQIYRISARQGKELDR